MKASKRKSNWWDNPLTAEHKALYLAMRELSKGVKHKFPPGMGEPKRKPDLTGVTLADSLPIIEGMIARTNCPITRKGLTRSLATLDQRCAELRDRP